MFKNNIHVVEIFINSFKNTLIYRYLNYLEC